MRDWRGVTIGECVAFVRRYLLLPLMVMAAFVGIGGLVLMFINAAPPGPERATIEPAPPQGVIEYAKPAGIIVVEYSDSRELPDEDMLLLVFITNMSMTHLGRVVIDIDFYGVSGKVVTTRTTRMYNVRPLGWVVGTIEMPGFKGRECSNYLPRINAIHDGYGNRLDNFILIPQLKPCGERPLHGGERAY